MKTILAIIFISLFANIAYAKKIKVENPEERQEYIKRAKAWLGAKWINEDLSFKDDLDILSGPKMRGKLKIIYQKNEAYCQTSQELLDSANSGKTEKFFCQLLDYDPVSDTMTPVFENDGDIEKIKVKYGRKNGEVYAEVISTRLLWALGFAADAVYHYENTYCYGCPPDPFKQRYIDESTLDNPRQFNVTAIEQKFKGDEIVYIGKQPRRPRQHGTRGLSRRGPRVYKIPEEGWSFREMNLWLSEDPDIRKEQIMHRDALRLLLSMISHADSKAANHRLVCEKGQIDEAGRCSGDVILMAQDLGVTFGRLNLGTVIGDLLTGSNPFSRVDFGRWKDQEVWSSKSKCRPRAGFNIAGGNFSDSISEEGRNFLYKLLKNFTAGDIGRQRLIDIFNAGRVELRSATAEQWANAFIKRIEEIKVPRKCPSAK